MDSDEVGAVLGYIEKINYYVRKIKNILQDGEYAFSISGDSDIDDEETQLWVDEDEEDRNGKGKGR